MSAVTPDETPPISAGDSPDEVTGDMPPRDPGSETHEGDDIPDATMEDMLSKEAAAEDEVPERVVFMSTAVLMTAVVLSATLMFAAMYGWYAIGHEVRSQVTWPQAGTLLFFMFFMIAMMMSLGYSRLWADEDGVVIRNGPVLRRFQVEDIAGLRLRPGDAWAYLLIKDGEGGVQRRAVLAIQQLEGAGARKKIRQLRAWLKANGANAKGVTDTDYDGSTSG